jgi:hypothetical protein
MNTPKKIRSKLAFKKQNDLIDGFTTRLEIMESDAVDHDHSPSQSESRTAGKMELINAIGNELTFAQRKWNSKEFDSSKVCDMVEPGAVVVTNKMTFYICVSIENFEVEGKDFLNVIQSNCCMQKCGLKKHHNTMKPSTISCDIFISSN